MKKPNSMMQLMGFIFFISGLLFVLAGYLSEIGLLTTQPDSKGEPSIVFPIIGIIFLIFGMLSFFIPLYKERGRKKLQENGVKVEGIVNKIKLLTYTHWGNRSPYVVYFTYVINDEKYNGKSSLLWETPQLCNGDKITVYVDEYKKYQYLAKI